MVWEKDTSASQRRKEDETYKGGHGEEVGETRRAGGQGTTTKRWRKKV